MIPRYKKGDTVRVVKLLDETVDKKFIGFTGKVDEIQESVTGDVHYWVGGHYMHEDELRKVITADKLAVHHLTVGLRSLEAVVGHLARIYGAFPELNDQVDIQDIIPMSLDEWETAIMSKVDELTGTEADDPRKLNPDMYQEFLKTFTDIQGAYEEYQQEFALTDEQPLPFDQWERREFDMFLSMDGDSYRIEK